MTSDDRLPAGTHLRLSVEVGPSIDFEASPASNANLRGASSCSSDPVVSSRRHQRQGRTALARRSSARAPRRKFSIA